MSGHRRHIPFFICGFFFFAGTTADVAHGQQFSATFERDVSRFRWTSDAFMDQRINDIWQISFHNRFSSDALIFGQEFTNFRDENRLEWSVGRHVNSTISGVARGFAGWFSQSEVVVSEAYAGVRYEQSDKFWIEPAVGAAWDRRPGPGALDGSHELRLDAGPAYSVRGQFHPIADDDYALSFMTDASWQAISPRQGRAARLGAVVQRQFEAATLDLELGYSNLRRDAYQAASFLNRESPGGRESETVEATASDTLHATARIEVPLGARVRAISSANLSAVERRVRTLRAPPDALYFDTDFDRRALNGEIGVEYDRRGALARVSVAAGAETERRSLTNRADLPPSQATQKGDLLRQADFDRGHLALRANFYAPFLSRFVANFNGSASILRHDTSELNADDRDEVFHTGQLGLLWMASRYLEADIRLFGNYNHTVYLRAARSAENNRQRSVRLRPTVRWMPASGTRVRVTSEVRATYTVDDFEIEGRRRNDQSARELRYEAAFEHRITRNIRVMADGAYSDLRLGRLMWDSFAEIPFDTLRTYSGWMRLQAGRRVASEVGFRFFIRSDFDRSVTVRYPRVDGQGAVLYDDAGAVIRDAIAQPGREWIEQLGPTCAIEWPMSRNSQLRFDGWVQFQRIYQQLHGELPELSADRIRRSARRGTRRMIPNLSISVIWNI